MENLLSYTDIQDARKRIRPFIEKTPIFSSQLLDEWTGHRFYFKMESHQKTGAFKLRGASNVLAWLKEENSLPHKVVANSSGNHAQAVALAAKLHGVKAAIYMPEFASKIKIQATRSYGAEVILCKTRMEADARVVEAAEKEGAYYIPPYNHPQIAAGQGTSAAEAIDEIGEVDLVVAPCGGGGLLSGTWAATHHLAPNAQIIGAEPLKGNDATLSYFSKKIHSLPKSPDTIADGARTLQLGEVTFPHILQLDYMYAINEEKILYWTQWLNHLLKVAIEPTSAMSMEAAKLHLAKSRKPHRVLIIVSGGNIDQPTQLKIWVKNRLETLPKF